MKYLAVCENWILVLSLQKIRAVLKINIAFWKQYTEQFQFIIHIWLDAPSNFDLPFWCEYPFDYKNHTYRSIQKLNQFLNYQKKKKKDMKIHILPLFYPRFSFSAKISISPSFMLLLHILCIGPLHDVHAMHVHCTESFPNLMSNKCYFNESSVQYYIHELHS